MSNCECFTEIDPQFLEDIETETGKPEWHALYTVVLGALIEDGIFSWEKPELDWSSAAYDAKQYARVCAYFIERFKYEEISVLPVKKWFNELHRRLAYELMPKYKPLYDAAAQGVNPFQDSDEWHKRRQITSDYPETLLSANADYASDGVDLEYETIKNGNIAEHVSQFAELYRGIDTLLLDELEVLFIQVYTANVNGL